MSGHGTRGPSLQAHAVRFAVKRMVGPKFRRAGHSIGRYRELNDFVIRNQKLPKGTEVSPVRPGDVPAEWVRAGSADPERVVLYLHGGAFIMGSPATHRELAARLSGVTGASMLVVDYRLAPEHPFPAAMHDAMAAYRWLLDHGYSPDRVAIGGDSAGGGLALQTLLALRDEGAVLPAAAFFLSPQTDWVRFDGESYATRAHVDPLNFPEMCRFSAAQYVGENDPGTPLLSPVAMDLSGLPPCCVHVGDHEILLSDSTRLAERASASGVDVDLRIWPGMWHVFQTSARLVPEARRSLALIGEFVQAHTACGGGAGGPRRGERPEERS